MLKKRRKQGGGDDGDINLTPMLDVVFIMLIFFIVTATFIKRAGIDVTRPEALTANQQPTVSVIVAIGEKGEIWIDNQKVDAQTVRAHIERLHAENPKGSMVIQSDKKAKYEVLANVLTAARGAGLTEVAISTES